MRCLDCGAGEDDAGDATGCRLCKANPRGLDTVLGDHDGVGWSCIGGRFRLGCRCGRASHPGDTETGKGGEDKTDRGPGIKLVAFGVHWISSPERSEEHTSELQ